ncbi:MAG TPA: cytochrome c oxidase assembly protein [Longimicrobiales bacterium]|nr:cytochrome c oxidase assembly protein [Longimicrobiales bacterium]
MALAVLLHGTSEFSWTRWPIHLSTVIGSAIFLWLYFMGIGPWRMKHKWGNAPETWRQASFVSGVVLILLCLNGPLHELADNYLFSAHMVQHLVLTLVMPPLLLAGCPDWLLRALIRRTVGMGVARTLTHPLIAFAIYNVVFAGWHVPLFYNWALEDHNIHILQHMMFMISATIMWWPVADPVPELVRVETPVRLLYLFALSIPMSIVSALITLSEDVLYTWYQAAPRATSLTAIDDQQLGGLIMWVPGALVFWVAISVVYFRWSASEDREEAKHRVALGGAAT